jgi:hypothetical protein
MSLPSMAERLLTEERDQEAELAMLEELWAASAALPARSRLGVVRDWLTERLGWVLAGGWLVFVASVFFTPAPSDPAAPVPLWADALIAGFFLSLGTAGILAAVRAGRTAWIAAAVAGGVGVALGVGCLTTAHHPSGWAIYELAATGALTALAVTGMSRRRS